MTATQTAGQPVAVDLEVTRSPLQTAQSVLAIIRDILLIVVLGAALIFGVGAVRALSDLGSGTADTSTSECVGEVTTC